MLKPQYQPVCVVAEAENESVPTTQAHDIQVNRHDTWFRVRAITIKTLAFVSVLVVPLALAIWLPQSMRTLRHVDIFESTPLGGSLTLTQAKAIDFVSSAVLAPLLLSAFNYVWFKNARTSIADEKREVRRGTSLYALVEASSTSSGSYDFFKFWTLCCSKSGRLVVFAMLALLSAVGKSSLSNIIAYEAITELAGGSSPQLRLLTGPLMVTSDSSTAQRFEPEKNASWIASYDQRRVFVQGTTAVLQEVSWLNSTTQLHLGAYTALNITTADMANLNSSVKKLHNVPAVRATAECRPHKLTSVDLFEANKNVGFQIYFDKYKSINETSLNEDWYTTTVLATIDILIDGSRTSSPYQSLDFLAYDSHSTSILVGCMGANVGRDPAWTQPNLSPIQSPLGEITAQSFPFSLDSTSGSNSSTYDMLVWSVACTINQQSGVVNLSQDSTSQNWHQDSALWNEDAHIVPSVLAGLYDVLGSMTFISGKSGLGPALTASALVQDCNVSSDLTQSPDWCHQPGARRLDFQTLVDNLLYAEMEIQRVSYEVAAMNQSLASPEMFASVMTFGDALRYRITYVPALLFAGMVCVFLAAVATVTLMVYSGRSIASRTFRHVDSLRLLVDYAVNNHDEQLTAVARTWNDDELQDWAMKQKVRYEGHQDLDGKSSTLVLQSVRKYIGPPGGYR